MQELQDNDPMPFGKYKGKAMEDVPANYLNWFWHEHGMKNNDPVSNYIKRNLTSLKAENIDLIWRDE